MNEMQEPGPRDWALHVMVDGSKLIQWGYRSPDDDDKRSILEDVCRAMRETVECLEEIKAGGHRGAMLDRIAMALKIEERGITLDELRQRIEEG